MTSLIQSKSERIDVRASSAVKQLLQEAARSCHKNVSEFLLEAGISAANQSLANRCHFGLDNAQWEMFQQALDRPVQSKSRLKKLLDQPGVLDLLLWAIMNLYINSVQQIQSNFLIVI